MRIGRAALALLVVAGCEQADGWGQQLRADVENFDLVAGTRRAFAESYQDQPFEEGAVSVLVTEHGALRTFSLTPCHGNTRICGSHAGTLRQTADYDIVSGAYPGRTFYLSPGGDGVVITNGVQRPLAWD